MQTVKAALEHAMGTIDRVDAHVLMAHVLGVNRAWLAANPMRVLTESEDARIDMMVAQRALGQPVAYIVERREFYGRDFMVNADVLIPRPETEVLVEAALSRLDGLNSTVLRNHGASCLDLGTGSGAIAVTLACERPMSRVTATDTSSAALALARANAQASGCARRTEFVRGPWYEPLGARRFDLIVSNPPYVAATDPHLAQGDLRFEPRLALTDGSRDGLDSIRAIVSGASDHLNAEGWLLVEHGYDQVEAVHSLLEATGFGEIVSIPDLAGIPRVAGGKMAVSSRRFP
jgi:release factor glutamine methyltransferase